MARKHFDLDKFACPNQTGQDIVGNGENACNQHILFPATFSLYSVTNSIN